MSGLDTRDAVSRDTLDRERLARIRARLDGACQEFDGGIDAILREVERLRDLRRAIGYLGERIEAPTHRAPPYEMAYRIDGGPR